MKRLLTAFAVLTLSTPSLVFSQDYSIGDMTIVDPWSRATPMVAPVAGGYLKISNSGASADVLLGGTSAVASAVEVHRSEIRDGIARMRPVPEGVRIEPNQTVELAPGGTHLMFIKPSRPFKEGDKIEATLRFERAGEIKVEFTVQCMGAKQPAEDQGHQGHDAAP